MSKMKEILKAGIVAGLVGLGLYGIERKCGVLCRISKFAQSLEIGPFPGTRIYPFLAPKQFREFYAAVADEIVGAGDAKRILDINTGTGFLPIEIARRNPNTRIFGIDQSTDMIQIANASSKAHGTGKSVDFYAGDPLKLPFPGMYFDLAVSLMVFNKWKYPLGILDEVYHVLSPGSEFRVYGYRDDITAEVWEGLRDRLPAVYRPIFTMGPVTSWRLAFSPEELLETVAQSRFKDPVIEHRTFTIFGIPMPIFYMLKMRKPSQPSTT